MLFDARIWGGEAVTAEESLKIAVLCLRQDLTAFYRERRRRHPNDPLTMVHDITPKMFGARDTPKLKFSGAETWGFVLYMVQALQRYSQFLPPMAAGLREGGVLLVRTQEILRGCGAKPDPSSVQEPASYMNRAAVIVIAQHWGRTYTDAPVF